MGRTVIRDHVNVGLDRLANLEYHFIPKKTRFLTRTSIQQDRGGDLHKVPLRAPDPSQSRRSGATEKGVGRRRVARKAVCVGWGKASSQRIGIGGSQGRSVNLMSPSRAQAGGRSLQTVAYVLTYLRSHLSQHQALDHLHGFRCPLVSILVANSGLFP